MAERKAFSLRVDRKVLDAVQRWANDDLRSLNGQIEFLLRRALQQSGRQLPVGPLAIAVHIASVWVPFTSESKEAVAHYPEIVKEIRLALQECGRHLGRYVNRRRKVADAERKRQYIEKYAATVKDLDI